MDVMFLEELADLKDKYPSRLALHHVLSREQRIAPLLSGRIDAEKLQSLLGTAIHADDVDEWFLCGPFELVQLCRDTLAARGVDPDHIRFELFTTGKPDRPEGNAGRPVVVDESQATYKITFKLDGLQGEVASPTHARESILNAALRVRPTFRSPVPAGSAAPAAPRWSPARSRWTRTTPWSRMNWTRATC